MKHCRHPLAYYTTNGDGFLVASCDCGFRAIVPRITPAEADAIAKAEVAAATPNVFDDDRRPRCAGECGRSVGKKGVRCPSCAHARKVARDHQYASARKRSAA